MALLYNKNYLPGYLLDWDLHDPVSKVDFYHVND
jgi:hypothetical protein